MDELKIAFDEQLRQRSELALFFDLSTLESYEQHDNKLSQLDDKISVASRKVSDLILAYNDLLEPLPEEVKFTQNNTTTDPSQEVKSLKQILDSGKACKRNTKPSTRMKNFGLIFATIGLRFKRNIRLIH